jgi:hypothetical protein
MQPEVVVLGDMQGAMAVRLVPTEDYWPHFSRDYCSGGNGYGVRYDICTRVKENNLATPELNQVKPVSYLFFITYKLEPPG